MPPGLRALVTARDVAQERKAEALRALHAGPEPLVLPNAWDAASARLFARAGFRAIATTSAGIANSWGVADRERISRAAMLQCVTRIASAVAVPVSADLEAGFGRDPESVAETTRGLIETGAVGMNLEDAVGARDRTLLSQGEQVARIRAARAAADALRVSVVINARTDVFAARGSAEDMLIEEALGRGNAYLEAGADGVFVPGADSPRAIAALAQGLKGPLNVLAGRGVPSVKELGRLGVRRVTLGSGPMRATLGVIVRIADELRTRGTYDLIAEWEIPYGEVQALFVSE